MMRNVTTHHELHDERHLRVALFNFHQYPSDHRLVEFAVTIPRAGSL